VSLPCVKWTDDRPEFVHQCVDGVGGTLLPSSGWWWDQGTDTVTPSVHCAMCGTHGFWTNGQWVPA
jgi:hypothetical protein